MHRDDLARLLDEWFEPGRFKDVAENGMQLEGTSEVHRVVCGVSANRALLQAARDHKADAVFVHHGIVWGGGIRKLTGWLGARVRLMMEAELSLFAYHLPLDAHPTLGNNAGLADALDVESLEPFGTYKGQKIGLKGTLGEPVPWSVLVERCTKEVGPPLVAFGDGDRPVRTLGLCTGGAPELLYEAVDEQLDGYITGEVTEWVQGVAEESGTGFIAGGHHATERFGAMRVCRALQEQGLDATFVDVDNPA